MGLSNIIDHPFSSLATRSASFFEHHLLPWLLPAAAKPALERKPADSLALAMLAGGQDPLLVAEWMRAEDVLTETEVKGSRMDSAKG